MVFKLGEKVGEKFFEDSLCETSDVFFGIFFARYVNFVSTKDKDNERDTKQNAP